MQRKFLTSLIMILALNLLIKPFWILGIDRAVQNTVGSEEYGFYFAILNFSFLLNILLDFGITNFNNRNIARNSQLLTKHFPGIMALKLVLAFVYFTVSFGIAWLIGYSREQMSLLALLAVSQFLLYLVLYLRSNISGLQLFKTDSLMSVLDRVLMIAFCSLLLWGNVLKTPFTIEVFVYAQVAAYLLTALTAFAIVVRKSGFRRLKWNFPFFLLILRHSLPFAILVLLMSFYNRIDSVMIERLLPGAAGDIQAGIYASAYRLLDAANMIAYLFSVILFPLFSRMLKERENVEEIVKLAYTILLAISVSVAFSSMVYSHQIIDLLYHHHIMESAEVFRLLMFGFVAISTTYVFGSLLTANGNLKHLNIMAAFGMTLNIGLNLILIPRMYAMGAVYASLATQFSTAIIQVIFAKFLLRFRINYRFLFKLACYIIAVAIAAFLSKQLPFDWKLNMLIAMLFSVSMVFALRILRIRYLIDIFQNRM